LTPNATYNNSPFKMRKERCKNGYSSSSAVGEKKREKKDIISFHLIW
jgi:hypothetical protein